MNFASEFDMIPIAYIILAIISIGAIPWLSILFEYWGDYREK